MLFLNPGNELDMHLQNLAANVIKTCFYDASVRALEVNVPAMCEAIFL